MENEEKTAAASAATGDTVAPKEEVASTEVKVDVPAPAVETPKVDVDVTKLSSQVENLNEALRQEREAKKSKIAELEERLGSSQETIDKLKNVFSPEQQPDPEPQGVTMEQIENLLEQRDQKVAEVAQKQTAEQKMKEEVKKLESEWNGEGGKPKYEDSAVLDWQEKNGKLYLSPREAFNEMNRDSIIDWEVNNRLNKKPEVKNVETPGGNPTGRSPEETKKIDPNNVRNAVLEAMGIANNN